MLAEAEYNTESGHQIKFQETEVLVKTSGCMDRLVKEAIKIRRHPKYIIREEGFKLRKAWNHINRLLRFLDAYRLHKTKEDKHKVEHAKTKIK
jgi:hypothetical protein